MAKPVSVERLAKDMAGCGLMAEPDPEEPERTGVSVDYGR